jgi:hypothetical protein
VAFKEVTPNDSYHHLLKPIPQAKRTFKTNYFSKEELMKGARVKIDMRPSVNLN